MASRFGRLPGSIRGRTSRWPEIPRSTCRRNSSTAPGPRAHRVRVCPCPSGYRGTARAREERHRSPLWTEVVPNRAARSGQCLRHESRRVVAYGDRGKIDGDGGDGGGGERAVVAQTRPVTAYLCLGGCFACDVSASFWYRHDASGESRNLLTSTQCACASLILGDRVGRETRRLLGRANESLGRSSFSFQCNAMMLTRLLVGNDGIPRLITHGFIQWGHRGSVEANAEATSVSFLSFSFLVTHMTYPDMTKHGTSSQIAFSRKQTCI